jgi:hypothetical protein
MQSKKFDTKKLWKKSTNRQSTSGNSYVGTKSFQTDPEKLQKIFSKTIPATQSSNFIQGILNKFQNIKSIFYQKDWFRQINYQLITLQAIKKANHIIAISITAGLLLFFAYLAFFDQNFIIRDYSIKFAEESYLNQSQVKRLVNHFHSQKLYGIFPNNQYFFLNSINLTTSAKEVFPEISKVSVERKKWPNQTELLVEINPILVTLAVKENNETKYWRIGSGGNVLSEDKAGIWENLVSVEKPYFLVEQSKQQSQKLSLQNYTFAKDKNQMKRFEATKEIWRTLYKQGITVISTQYPSISDTDIIIKTDNGTRLFFDSEAFTNSVQSKRINEFLASNIDKQMVKESESQGKFAYLDFRIKKRIYFCKVSEVCAKE